MLSRVLLLGLIVPTVAPAQNALWQHVSAHPNTQMADEAHLSRTQLLQVRELLSARGMRHSWECEMGNPHADWLQNLTYRKLPLAPPTVTILVESGPGCARGGQGANGAMWVVRVGPRAPQLLAVPDLGFSGWLYDVPHAASHGLRDIVLGWHMSAADAGLTYFRFDGHRYRQIGAADALFDEDGNARIVPTGSVKPSQ